MKESGKLKFRETLWFKKGELDAEAAQDAARDADDLLPGAVDLLPVDDRYLDDGGVTRGDSVEFGVHSGTTQHLACLDREPLGARVRGAGEDGGVDVRDLVGEMKRGRRAVFAAMGAAALAFGLIALLCAV